MSKMAFLSLLSLLTTISGENQNQPQSVHRLPLYDSPPATSSSPVAISLPNHHLNDVAGSVIKAESWLRSYVLNYYPSANITVIVVGHDTLCHVAGSLFLPALKNLHHSLIRWGLHRDIEVSPSLSSTCLHLDPSSAETLIKPLLVFLVKTNYSYSINPSEEEGEVDDALFLVETHTEYVRKLGFRNFGKINLLKISPKDSKPIKFRRLSSMGLDPFSPRPNPLAGSGSGSGPAPAHSPVFFSGPHTIPLPPLVGNSPPFSVPGPPTLGPALPPCDPNYHTYPISPAPVMAPSKAETWCVAKPSVPSEALQEAMDYACGEGGADCEAIGPTGSCYFPDTVVAHASYAFNSYWQRHKRNGGTCGFGGTAMLINSDPSFSHCRFILA